MVLQDGVVKQIYRDATQAGGWNVNALPDANEVIQMVAGISGPIASTKVPATLKVFYVKPSVPNTLFIATETTPPGTEAAPSFATTSVPWDSSLRELRIAQNFDNSVLVTTMAGLSSLTATDGKLHFYTDGLAKDHADGAAPVPATGTLTGFSYYTENGSPIDYLPGHATGWSAVVAQPTPGGGEANPQLILCLPAGTYGPSKVGKLTITFPSVDLWSWDIAAGTTTAGAMNHYSLTATVGPPNAAPTKPQAYSIENAVVLGSLSTPSLLIRTLDTDGKTQRLWLLSPDDLHHAWTWTPLGLPDGLPANAPLVLSTALRPLPSSEIVPKTGGGATSFLDVFVVAAGSLSVLRQAPQGNPGTDLTQPVYCPLIPLQPDVAEMTSQAGSSSGNELLLAGTDGTLQTLLKDPVTGHWSDAPIQLPSSELQQVSAYRVELTVQDSWNAGVSHLPLRLTASTPVTAMVDGQAVNLGTTPATVTTDAQGQAVIALVADGLSAPALTITGDAVPTATIYPSGPLNTYMQGGTPLNYQPPLDAGALQKAQTADGQLVAPNLSDADASENAGHLTSAATWGAGTSLAGARGSATLARPDGRLGGRNAQGRTVTATGILSDIDNWAHDALHAIKKAAVAVTAIAVDAAAKTFTLTADFAQWAEKGLTIVVHGIEDAAHVFHAVLNKIGAAILHAIKWLEAEVLGLLLDTAALAGHYNTWLDQCTGFIGDQLTTDANKVDAWLAAQQAGLGRKFTTLASGFAPGTTLSTMAANPPQGSPDLRASGAPRGASDDGDGQSSPHRNWFLNKVKNALLGQLDTPDIAGVENMLAEVLTAMKGAMADFRDAFDDFWQFLKTVIEHPSQVATLGVKDLLLALSKLIDAMFTLLRGVVHAMMAWFASLAGAIPKMLDTPLSALPIVGKLLELMKLGNVPISHLFTLALAFPTVLAYKIAHGGKGRPFAGSPVAATRGRLGAGEEAADLQFCAGGALLAWAGIDALSGAYTASDLPAPMFFSAVDIAAPLIVTLLTVPATNGGEPFFSPPDSANESDQMNFGSWILGAVPAFSVATGVYVDQKLSKKPDASSFKAMLLGLTSACGVMSLVTGCYGNQESSDPSGADYAVAVLNNMANIVALLLEDGFVKSSEGVTAVVAAAITATCGGIGAVVYGVDG